MMSDKKLIFIKLLILLALLFVLDRGIGALLEHFFFTKKSGFDARANYVINKTNADVLIFGSSKAAEHYNSRLLQDSLHLSVYNAGRDLSYIYYHYAILEAALKRYTPKLVILDTRPNEFEVFPGHEDLDRLNVLLPYYDTHPELRDIILMRSTLERYKLLSKMYPYNSLILQELIELLPLERYKKDDSELGYIGKTGQWNKPKPPYVVDDAIDTAAAAFYKKFVELCKAKHVKLMVTFSPLYQNIDAERNKNVACIQRICKANNIPVFSYLHDAEFSNVDYFFNDLHLNRKGSTIFSNRIVPQIRQVLNSNL
jgi:hypothetical protein